MQFKKKPTVIEATQWFKLGDHPAVVKAIKGYNGAISTEEVFSGTYTDTYAIETLEGNMEVTPGDWIITGVKGEQYPCKPDIFELTYESV